MKRALITGVTGQTGSHLAELLLSKGYEVHGLMRRTSSISATRRVDHLYRDPHDKDTRFFLHHCDLTDHASVARIVSSVCPDEVYHLGAQSHVKVSFEQPLHTADATGLSTLRMLEALRTAGLKNVRFYQASSSELWGNAPPPQNENTPMRPRSPYACAKLFAHTIAVNYREAYGMHISCGILHNHTGPRRGETFVCRKITRAVGRIAYGLQKHLYLGNLDAMRDWMYAGDAAHAMWLMLQQDEPGDYVVGTGEMYAVREFVRRAFAQAGLVPDEHVRFDARYLRPAEVDALCADASKARRVLGWEPTVAFPELVTMMVTHDLEQARQEALLADAKKEVCVGTTDDR